MEDILSDDDTPETVYIQPPSIEDGAVSGEDDADEEESGIPDNVCPEQLKANCEIVMQSGRRIDSIEETAENPDENVDNENEIEDIILAEILENSDLNIETELLEVPTSEYD